MFWTKLFTRDSHTNTHRGIEALCYELTWAIDDLNIQIKELREEIDYLSDFVGLDD